MKAFKAAIDKVEASAAASAGSPSAAAEQGVAAVSSKKQRSSNGGSGGSSSSSKKESGGGAALAPGVRQEWTAFAAEVAKAQALATAAEGGFAFAFVEGALVKAVREGWWLLLDEINLAPAEVRAVPCSAAV